MANVELSPNDTRLDWMDAQYELTLRALSDLDFSVVSDRACDLAEIKSAVTPAVATVLYDRQEAGCQDELVIAPFIGKIGLIGSEDAPGLVPRFDSRQYGSDKTDYDFKGYDGDLGRPLHDFKDNDPVHDNRSRSPAKRTWQVGVVLGDLHDPRDRSLALTEPGLVYRGRTVDLQRQAFLKEQQRLAKEGVPLNLVTLAQMFALAAQRRIAGTPLPDSEQGTETRLIHYPHVSQHSLRELTPSVRAVGHQVIIGFSLDYDGERMPISTTPSNLKGAGAHFYTESIKSVFDVGSQYTSDMTSILSDAHVGDKWDRGGDIVNPRQGVRRMISISPAAALGAQPAQANMKQLLKSNHSLRRGKRTRTKV